MSLDGLAMSEDMHEFAVVSVNVSERTGTVKTPVASAEIGDRGLLGDAHAGSWHRQVSILAQESVERFAAEIGRPIQPGEFGENLTIRGVDGGPQSRCTSSGDLLRGACLLDRFRIGQVELELTQIGKSCHGDSCAIFRQVGRCVMPVEGIFCRVLSGGMVRPGDRGLHVPKSLQVRIITLSDRAAAGAYADRSGPRIREVLQGFFAGRPWRVEFAQTILPDDPDRLRAELASARQAGADIVFTTGGTGVGPRDTTPEVVAAFCDRLIPGIMEHIRIKSAPDNPNAVLSRSVAGLAGTMLLYALPGSTRAVEEYLAEIVKTLEHVLLTSRGIDPH